MLLIVMNRTLDLVDPEVYHVEDLSLARVAFGMTSFCVSQSVNFVVKIFLP